MKGDGSDQSLALSSESRHSEVELRYVRQGLRTYQVRYSYYTKEHGRGDDVRKEATRIEEAYCAADAITQVAIAVDNIYASVRCKILEVKPYAK